MTYTIVFLLHIKNRGLSYPSLRYDRPLSGHLVFRFNQAIFAVFPFVYDIDGFRFRIEEHEEIVAHEIHLQDSFFYVHRTGCKFLDSGNFEVFFRCCRSFYEAFMEGTAFHAACQFCFVFMDLAYHFIVNQIDSRVHIIVGFDATKDDTIYFQGNFSNFTIFFDGKKSLDIDFIFEVLRYFLFMFQYIVF